MAMTACGSGTPGAASGDDKKDDSGGGTSGPASTGDPGRRRERRSATTCRKRSTTAFQPIRDADATLDSIAKLPADLKAAKASTRPS